MNDTAEAAPGMPEIAYPPSLAQLCDLVSGQGGRQALLQVRRDDTEVWTAPDLAARASAVGRGLRALGVAPGERCMLFAPNSPRWFIACLALLDIGAVPVPVDSQAGHADLAHIKENSGARFAFTTAALAQRLREAGAHDLHLVLLQSEGEHADALDDIGRDALTAQPKPERSPEQSMDPGREAVLFYTSGTSGPPKGVPLTHANLLANIRAILSEDIVRPDDRLLLPLPLHHVYPFALGLLAPLILGVPVIMPQALTGPQLVRAMQAGEVTAILGIPRLYAALFSAIRQRVAGIGKPAAAIFDGVLWAAVQVQRRVGVRPAAPLLASLRRRVAPRLRILISGGAALDEDLAWRLEALGWTVTTGYGLTETSPILTFNPPGARRFETAGRSLSCVRVRVADPAGEAADGEVQASGDSVFGGYLDMPDKNREAFTDDGWFRTGDLGHLGDDGWLTLRGRATARIVLPGGENVDPERIEQRLDACPSIREAGVLEHDGRLAALAVPEPAAARDRDADGVKELLRKEISAALKDAPSYQRIGVLRVDSAPLPRTRLGKLRRYLLAERFAEVAGAERAAPEPGLADRESLAPEDRQLLEDETAARVWSWLGERFPDRRITPDSDLRLDLDVDSLEWVSLTLDLQSRVSIELGEDAIGRIDSVRDLLREAAAADAAATPSGKDLEQRLAEPEDLLDPDQRRWLEPPSGVYRALGLMVHRLLRWSMRGIWHLKATGLEHLPRTGACLLTPNHQSSLDPAAVLAVLDDRRRRETCWGGWTGLLFSHPAARLLSRSFRVLPVDPSRSPLSSLAFGAAALQRGCMLVWFPEGQRSKDGKLLPFRPGVGTLARLAGVPIVPAYLTGTGEALPAGRLRPHRGHIRIRIGEPLDPAELEAAGDGDTPAERIANALRARVQALAGS